MTTAKSTKTHKISTQESQAQIAANNFLRKQFAPVKKSLYLAWLCDVITVLLLMAQAFVLAMIFSDWLTKFVPAFTTHDGWSMNEVGLSFYLAILAVLMLIRALLGYARDAILSKIGIMVAGDVRGQLLDQLAKMGMARRYFGADGVLASKIIDEPDYLVGYARFEVQKMTAVTTPVMLAIFVGFINGWAAAILLVTAPLVPLFMALIGKATSKKSREQMDAMAQLGGRFFDWIRGINTLDRLQAVAIAGQDIEHSAEGYRTKTMNVLKIAFLNSAVLEFLTALSIALVAVYLGFGLMGLLPWQKGVMSVDYHDALLILLLVPEFYAPLRRLGMEYHIKGQAVSAASVMVGLMDFKSAHTGSQQVNFANPVSFGLTQVAVFGDDGRLRLPPTTMTFEAGQSTVLTGSSGAGKSTILQILLGFGQYTGKIWLDDGQKHDYQTLDMAQLRSHMGYLSQTPALLPISIADNLRLAKPDASDDELLGVLAQVGLDALMERLPQGIHTVLGERGSGVSGGQAHRIAIAQLILTDACVWLLDEPTEHLDPQTADEISALLHRLSKGKTVIWVSHHGDLTRFDQHIHLGAKA
ncbi:thiol reductant ABC exporter subunit CydD [Moraxella nasicaprae]|uniref:Thiol reductant ABC exporter subunit CydD n=1 Tax=Moraxella nasicaprae TaxID=2904122 RepID=A0ABY6F4D1_9GAMM|nr:thiol reductant ABC exporter subunit CydD [Moraxella nasicaprae]UXZ04951.1 thiol reductant ABC exporter subunit CydD [Moraxella nasicaprae]